MDKLLPYWRFFCDNTFAQDDKLQFFNDGSFAITSKDGIVSLYSDEAKLVKRYENAFALQNGCICEQYGENLIIHYQGTQYPIAAPSGTKIHKLCNAVELSFNKEPYERRLYFITPQFKNLRYIVLDAGVAVQGTSKNRLVALFGKTGTLLDADGSIVDIPKPFHRVDFLPDGGFIVHYTGDGEGALLYNAEHEPVLQSEMSYGILPLGDKVLYENALIADINGNFIAKYQQESAIYGKVFIYPYVITTKGHTKEAFWHGGNMMCVHIRNAGMVLCYQHGGHFYFIPQCLSCGRKSALADLILQGSEDKAFGRYLKRIYDLLDYLY